MLQKHNVLLLMQAVFLQQTCYLSLHFFPCIKVILLRYRLVLRSISLLISFLCIWCENVTHFIRLGLGFG